jgi:heparin/heparan-sulfate lyase
MNRRTLLGLPLAAWAHAQDSLPLPPAGHPRLYLRAGDLDLIRQRTKHPAHFSVAARLKAAAQANSSGATIARVAEIARSNSLVCLLEENEAAGREAIRLIAERVPAANWDLAVQDISREIGLVMLSAGMTYDWCFPLLDASMRTLFIEQIERLARLLEVGYPPTRQSSITSHTGEAMLLRDMLGCGITIFDESPDMWRVSAERTFREMIPARNFFYPSHTHHQGNAYGPYRFKWEILNAWILKRLTGYDYYDPAMGQVPYHWLYSRRPDGVQIPDGDMFSGNLGSVYCLTASYFGDPILQGAFIREPDYTRQDPIEQLLFGDPELEAAPHTALPLTKFFSFPLSAMIARTGWESKIADPVIAEIKVKDYHFNNHHHLDAGAFQIHYRQPLAVDSGIYRTYGSDHDNNYYKRTIAHNAMLVFDPAEQFLGGRRVNDGGQRWPDDAREQRSLEDLLKKSFRTGRVVGRACGPDAAAPVFSYLEGDLHEAYSAKVRAYQRAFVFLALREPGRPALAVVLDRMTAARADLKKYWLLHTQVEPKIEDGRIVVRQTHSELIADMLLPVAEDRDTAMWGGPGREYMVFGENHPPPPGTPEPDPWRVEVTPREPAEFNLFLAVLQVLDRGGEALPVERMETDQLVGARCGAHLVCFARREARLIGEISLGVAGDTSVRCLVAGLAAGRWRVEGVEPDLEVAEESGCAWFEAPPGRVVMNPAG